MTINAHIDGQKNKTIDGVTFTNTHSGQKRAYGDSFYEYDVESDRPESEVEQVCATHVYKAMPETQYREENRAKPSMENHFRSHYKFTKTGDGKYRYVVTVPFAD